MGELNRFIRPHRFLYGCWILWHKCSPQRPLCDMFEDQRRQTGTRTQRSSDNSIFFTDRTQRVRKLQEDNAFRGSEVVQTVVCRSQR